MPKVRDTSLETATARRKLPVRKKPFFVRIAPGISLGYRRNEGAGTWSVRVAQHGAEWIKKIGIADDHEPAKPPLVLGYYAAIDEARKLARREPGDRSDASHPLTLGDALEAYADNLASRGGATNNARRVRLHLSPGLLTKPVGLLTVGELVRWCNSLVSEKSLAPASANRMRNSLRAALTLAARKDRRIVNRHVWQDELEALDDAKEARNVVLSDEVVAKFVAAAYQHDHALGLLAHVMAETGGRPSQLVRLQVDDLDVSAPKLMMPKSGKGNPRNRARKLREKIAVPITPGLARRLAKEARGRGRHDRLLLRSDGTPWRKDPSVEYRRPMIAVVTSIGLDPEKVTLYALRHSAITRQLLAGMPSALVAHLADTSEAVIRRHYGKLISDHADAVARKGLLDLEPPVAASNVVTLTKAKA